MSMQRWLTAVIVAFLWSGSLSAEVIFDSDATINYAIDEEVWMLGPDDGSGMDPPVINVVDPADISGRIWIYQTVFANFSGGTIRGLLNAGGEAAPSVLNFSGTQFERKVYIGSGAIANVSAGEFHGFQISQTLANISGGVFYTGEFGQRGLTVSGVLNFSGGLAFGRTFLATGSGSTASGSTISGGHLAGGLDVGSGTVDIFGGRIDDQLGVGFGEIHLSGGQIEADLLAMNGGAIHVYGYDLLHADSLLNGTLSDGSPISVSTMISADAGRPDGQIILHQIPEPAVGVLAIGAMLALAVATGVQCHSV